MVWSCGRGAAPILAAVYVLSVATGIAGAYALPATSTNDDGKAETHAHWEHIVRRAADYGAWADDWSYEDDTAHIVNVQEYYRNVFSEPWTGYADMSEVSTTSMHQITNVNLQGSMNFGPHTKPIKGRYIVMFSPNVEDDYVLDKTIEILEVANYKSRQRLRATDIVPFRNVHRGFTATLNSKTLELMHRHPLVQHIEEDVALRRSEYYMYQPVSKQDEQDAVSDQGSSHIRWNLDRLDQRANRLDGQFNPEGTGENVDIYICDTGIRYTHNDLEGRASYAGYDAIDELTGSTNKGSDCHGHGTHCAGTAAGKTYGVAKKATLFSLRTLDCTGTGAVSGIIQAMNFVVEKRKTMDSSRPVIVSLSLGLEISKALNMAIQDMTKLGYVMVSAAGNQGGDSCRYSPASARVGISVGATDKQDRVMYFSNTGDCTDIFAPGQNIMSASNVCDTCSKFLSGTSMSCPHVTGYAAILLGLRPSLTPEEVKEQIVKQSTKGAVTVRSLNTALISQTHNRLLYVPQAGATDMDFSLPTG